jgi:hypothetical protein
MIRFLIAASLALSVLLILAKVELRLPRVAPSPPSLIAPVLASAKSL